MKFRHLMSGAAIPALLASLSALAYAQTEITDSRTTGVATSTAGDNGTPADVTVTSTGSITVDSGAAITVDSDNSVINEGTLSSDNADDTTGILIGGVTGNVANNGNINLTGNAPDGGITPDSDIVTGSGRTGILISGASPFTGNVTNSGSIDVQGQNSAGIRLASGSDMVGTIEHNRTLKVFGPGSVAIDIAGNLDGDVTVNGTVGVTGENSQGVNVSGDMTGTLSINAGISVSGFVNSSGATVLARTTLAGREALNDTGNLRQAGSAVHVSGNIDHGIHFGRQTDPDTGAILSFGTVTMAGSAPAILIDGNGTPIAIGVVARITDPNDENYDADLQYAFVNQGTLAADGFLNDADATTFSLADATLQGGLNNSGTMRATVYRSGVDPAALDPTHDALARVIVIGGGGIAERINNSGTILARGFEAADEVYADRDNIQAPNLIRVTAIDILSGGSLADITNTGSITAVVTARNGEAVAVRDRSGTLISLNNQGTIGALGVNSDSAGEQATSFNLIAIDVTTNTSGFTLNQTQYDDPDVEDDPAPAITGDILLGSGNDVVNIAAGTVDGDISFGNGADVLTLSGGAQVNTSLSDSDGNLAINVADNATLTITGPADFNVSSASFDATSTYSPFIDPSTGEVSVMNASGVVSFADGAQVIPRLATVLADPTTTFTIIQAGTLNLGGSFGTVRGENTPFLYNINVVPDPNNPNTLIMTVDLRDTQELGLDTAQAAVFSSTFEALQNSQALGSAFVGLTDQASFNAAYNQLLPEFAAAARQFIIANVDGSVGAVGSHLNTARRNQEKPGGLWIEQIAYFADQDLIGLSNQFRGYGFGFTGGLDTAFGPFHTAGLNVGFTTAQVEDVLGVDKPFNVLSLQGGLYGGMQFGNLGIDLYAGGGYDKYDSNRNVVIGNFNQSARGKWTGTHVNASANIGYDIDLGAFYTRPSASFSYLRLKENAYTETGDEDIALAIDSRTSEVGTGTLMLDIGKHIQKKRYWLAPSLNIGYKYDFMGDSVLTTGQFVGGTTPFVLTSQDFPKSGVLVGFSLYGGSKYSSLGFDYDADIRSGFIRHTARIVIRLIF